MTYDVHSPKIKPFLLTRFPSVRSHEGTVTIKQAVFYFAVAADQVGSAKGDGKGNSRPWLRQNEKDVANSNTEQTINGKYTAVQVCQGVGKMKAGDKFAARTIGDRFGSWDG